MTRILVTGANGSLGSAMARHLVNAGADVVAMVRPGEDLGGLRPVEGQFELRIADVRDRVALDAALRGIDEVYHFAGVAITLNRLHEQMVAVNVEGSRNTAEAARAAGVRRLVYASSISAIGYPPPGEIADETFDITRTVCTNSYQQTKRAGEEAILAVGTGGDLEVVIASLSAVIAPYSHLKYGWAAIVDGARRGKLKVYPPGGAAFCGIEDMAEGALAAMAKGRPGERYIITTANLTHAQLFGRICELVGSPPPRLRAPAAVVKAAGVGGQLWSKFQRDPMKTPFLVPENADLSINRLWYDTSKAQRELGFRPTTLDPSIVAVRDWLAKEHRGGARRTG